MPIGQSKFRPNNPLAYSVKRSREAGFSLVEILVVLVIIGLMSSLVVMSMRPQVDPLETQLKTMSAHINESISHAIIHGVSTGFGVSTSGYGVFSYQDQQWKMVAEQIWVSDEKTNTSSDIEIEMEKQGVILSLKADVIPQIVFEPTGISTPFHLRVRRYDVVYSLQSNEGGFVRFTKRPS